MPDVARALSPELEPDHFIVRPEGAVHENTGGRLHVAPHGRVDRRQPWGIQRAASRHLVFDDERDVVSGDRGLPVGRVRSRLAGHRHGSPGHAHDAVDGEGLAAQADATPIDAAVVGKNLKDGVALREIRVRAVRAPQGPGPRGLPEHVQPCRVIDLTVHQHDPRQRRIPGGAPGL